MSRKHSQGRLQGGEAKVRCAVDSVLHEAEGTYAHRAGYRNRARESAAFHSTLCRWPCTRGRTLPAVSLRDAHSGASPDDGTGSTMVSAFLPESPPLSFVVRGGHQDCMIRKRGSAPMAEKRSANVLVLAVRNGPFMSAFPGMRLKPKIVLWLGRNHYATITNLSDSSQPRPVQARSEEL